jgi:hypothetical protein
METTKDGPKYTTVGSIVNPNSAPLQPPTRKGRTVKWPLQSGFRVVTSPLPDFSFGLESCTAPDDYHPPHYFPLQQNTDRAVSPAVDTLSYNVPNQPHASILSAKAASFDKQNTDVSSLADEAEDEDMDDHDALKQMSVKTLTNLASYENPKQKTAQKILSRAREMQAQTVRAYGDPNSVAGMVQSDGPVDQDGKAITYNSILSNGPGAPRPLTAGPPGVRQYRAAIMDCASSGRRSTTLAEEYMASQNTRKGITMELNHTHGVSIPSIRASSGLSYKVPQDKDRYCQPRIIDTLRPDVARKYYENGLLPANFNHQAELLIGLGCSTEDYLNPFATRKQRMLAHNAKIDVLWNEGTKMLVKSMEQALIERENRDLERLVGRDPDEHDLEKTSVNTNLSVEQANTISAQDHAEPILSMAFQTLINLETFTGSGKLPKLEYREL